MRGNRGQSCNNRTNYGQRGNCRGFGRRDGNRQFERSPNRFRGSRDIENMNTQTANTPLRKENEILDSPISNKKENKQQVSTKVCGGCVTPGWRHRRSCKVNAIKANDAFKVVKLNDDSERISSIKNTNQNSMINEKEMNTLSNEKNAKPITMTEVDMIQKIKFEKVQEEHLKRSLNEQKKDNLISEAGYSKQTTEANDPTITNKMNFNETIAGHRYSQNIAVEKKSLEQIEKIVKKEIKKEKKLSDEEVVCLGKLERFENLVDDEEDSIEKSIIERDSIRNICLICDREGHSSLECQMVCKNCSEPYHNLKKCPNPVNISVMLQQFFEFCMKQCCEYNPDQKFQPNVNNISTKSKLKSNSSKTLETSHSHRKRKRLTHSSSSNEMTESDSSCDIKNSTKKRKKKSKTNDFGSDLTQQYANYGPFAPTMPFAAFSGHTTSTAFNPMMAFGPMLHGFNNPKLPSMGIPR